MKITRDQFKLIVKECLVEILAEGLPDLRESRGTQPRKVRQAPPPAPVQRSVTREQQKRVSAVQEVFGNQKIGGPAGVPLASLLENATMPQADVQSQAREYYGTSAGRAYPDVPYTESVDAHSSHRQPVFDQMGSSDDDGPIDPVWDKIINGKPKHPTNL